MANNKLLDRAKELGIEPVENESDEDLLARINEAQNSKDFDPTEAQETTEPLAAGKCPDCRGDGVRSPEATQVCSTCQGTGKV